MDMNPNNNRDTFQGRGVRIKELEEQVEQLKKIFRDSEEESSTLIEQLKQKLLYKQQRFDKLWDLCCNFEFTRKALKMFEEWENE